MEENSEILPSPTIISPANHNPRNNLVGLQISNGSTGNVDRRLQPITSPTKVITTCFTNRIDWI